MTQGKLYAFVWRNMVAILLLVTLAGVARAQEQRHPLDPLSAQEIDLAVTILQQSGKILPGTRFGLIELHEPPKAQVKTDLANASVE